MGKEVLADTRAETKRRQASAKAKKPAAKAKAPAKRKPALKRLGTMAKTATVSSVIPEETTKYLLLFFRKEKRTLNELERNPHENVRVVDRKKAANNLLLLDDILEHFSCHLFIVSYGSYLKLGSRVISIEIFFFYLV